MDPFYRDTAFALQQKLEASYLQAFLLVGDNEAIATQALTEPLRKKGIFVTVRGLMEEFGRGTGSTVSYAVKAMLGVMQEHPNKQWVNFLRFLQDVGSGPFNAAWKNIQPTCEPANPSANNNLRNTCCEKCLQLEKDLAEEREKNSRKIQSLEEEHEKNSRKIRSLRKKLEKSNDLLKNKEVMTKDLPKQVVPYSVGNCEEIKTCANMGERSLKALKNCLLRQGGLTYSMLLEDLVKYSVIDGDTKTIYQPIFRCDEFFQKYGEFITYNYLYDFARRIDRWDIEQAVEKATWN